MRTYSGLAGFAHANIVPVTKLNFLKVDFLHIEDRRQQNIW